MSFWSQAPDWATSRNNLNEKSQKLKKPIHVIVRMFFDRTYLAMWTTIFMNHMLKPFIEGELKQPHAMDLSGTNNETEEKAYARSSAGKPSSMLGASSTLSQY